MSFAYDAIGRTTTESLTVNFAAARTCVVTRAYDADNRETATTYPNGKIVNRSYTSRGQLGEVDYYSAMVSQFTYDPGMRESQRTLGNGLDTRREYNRGDNLVTNIINETAPGSSDRPDASFSYTYDANKNPTSETTGTPGSAINGYSFTASYDAKDRLTGWNRANSIDSQLWSLTHVGDWSSTTINGTTQTRTHNAVHELTGIAGNNLAYDPEGDLTGQISDTVDRFKWDFDNKMVAADVNQDGTDDLTFTYDALGRRVSKDDVATGTNTVYVCSGSQVVCEYAANDDPATTAPQQVYVYGIYVDEPLMKVAPGSANVKLYYLRNRQYCITALTDSSGNVVERYAYTAYGITTILAPDGIAVRATSAVGNPYMYTGRRLDKEFAVTSENAVYYYRARYYIPQLGRFIGRDPMGYVDGMSMYQYVGSGPGQAVDWSGTLARRALTEQTAVNELKKVAAAWRADGLNFAAKLLSHFIVGRGGDVTATASDIIEIRKHSREMMIYQLQSSSQLKNGKKLHIQNHIKWDTVAGIILHAEDQDMAYAFGGADLNLTGISKITRRVKGKAGRVPGARNTFWGVKAKVKITDFYTFKPYGFLRQLSSSYRAGHYLQMCKGYKPFHVTAGFKATYFFGTQGGR